jgi:hypothetical protein
MQNYKMRTLDQIEIELAEARQTLKVAPRGSYSEELGERRMRALLLERNRRVVGLMLGGQ